MKHLNKAKRFLALFVTAAVLAGCSKAADTASGDQQMQESRESQKEAGGSAGSICTV